MSHMHFDIDDVVAKLKREIEHGCKKTADAAQHEGSRRFVELQRRLHLASVEQVAQVLRLVNEGHDHEMIARALSVVVIGNILSFEGIFGHGFVGLLARQMTHHQAGRMTHVGSVEINAVEGGTA